MECWDLLTFFCMLSFLPSQNYHMPISLTSQGDKEISTEGHGTGIVCSLLCCTPPTPVPSKTGMSVLIA